ncbi:hypothetical protein EC957_009569 [Mortierella hygrophila]|uniref:Uncharacterized protein n=1 Tax=Mortierella hygrophila TaxID=979708 RepID=A0A9P6FB30_9FUNG|nr:hypothetical protein EC957_009569 [Mortierella hygrophila]
MQAQGRFQAARPVLPNGLSAITGTAPTDADIFYIDIHPDPAAAVEIVLWSDIIMMFKDAVYVRHNLRTLAFLKGTDFTTLIPNRIAALPNTVLEVVVNAPLNVTGNATPSPAPVAAPATAPLTAPLTVANLQQATLAANKSTSYHARPSLAQTRVLSPLVSKPIPLTATQLRPPLATPNSVARLPVSAANCVSHQFGAAAGER